jgi:hypothetical protein
MTLFKKGDIPWNLGIPISEATREACSIAATGRIHSQETIDKRIASIKKTNAKKAIWKICEECNKEYKIKPSKANESKFCSRECKDIHQKKTMAGDKNYNYKPKIIKQCECCGKDFEMVESAQDRRKCCSKECDGKIRSEKYSGENSPCYKEKIEKVCEWCGKEYSVIQSQDDRSKFCSIMCHNLNNAKNQCGEDHWNFKGYADLDNAIRSCNKMDNWKREVLADADFKDEFTGIRCHRLHPHHIKPYEDIVKDNNITTFEEAMACDELWDKNNGIALTEDNHMNGFHRKNNGNDLLIFNLPFYNNVVI